MRASWAERSRPDVQSSPSVMLNMRKTSVVDFQEPSLFMKETYSQIDSIMSKCKETVPNLIGQLREKRLTNSGIALPVGYRYKELLGR